MSVKRGKTSLLSQKSGRPSPSMDYKLFAMNFFGPSLNPIKEELILKIKDGLRRNIFVIDMEEEARNYAIAASKNALLEANEKLDKNKKAQKGSKTVLSGKSGLLAVALNAINERKKQYELTAATLEKEKSFDLIHYWTNSPPPQKADKPKDQDTSANKGPKSKIEINDKENLKNAQNRRKSEIVEDLGEEEGDSCEDDGPEIETLCLDTVAAQHNKFGNPEPLMGRKYIEDFPLPEIMYFVLIGEFNRDFYVDLLNANEPLQAVINFAPEESTYDRLLLRKDNRKFIKDTMSKIQRYICYFREPNETIPTGFFVTQLPVLSPCLAKKYADFIFAELSWYMYDIQLLLRQYYIYYINAFRVTDVSLPKSIELFVLREKAKVLEVAGHYYLRPPLALGNEVATIALYVDKLLSSVAMPPLLLNNEEVEHLRSYTMDPTNLEMTHQSKRMMDKYLDGFESITESKRYERVCVEGANELLLSLIESVRRLEFPAIFRSCLEYSLMKKTFIKADHAKCNYLPYDDNMELLTLPLFVRFYCTKASVVQRLDQLLMDFDEYEILETIPKHRLYVFRRTYNEIFDYERQVVIPTRLCFRDFTIYQMEEFYRVLVTPDQRRTDKDHGDGIGIRANNGEMNEDGSFTASANSNLFIRPNSLKSAYLDEGRDYKTYGDCAISPSTEAENGDDTTSAKKDMSSDESYVGLPPCHPMLMGYNLNEARQIVTIKDSKYYFDEGHIKFNEERWNFDILNRCLELKINESTLYFSTEKRRVDRMSNILRIVTRNDVTIRINNSLDQCIKIMALYPNGLNVYYFDTYTEQKWSRDDTVNDESKRINTPYGAVIVYFHHGKHILVMRYNGEVYQLVQFDAGEEECEGDSDLCGQAPSLDRFIAGGDKKPKRNSESTMSIGDEFISSMDESFYDEYRELLSFELKFIEDLKKTFQLKWVRLVVTTSTGRRFMVPNHGLVIPLKPCDMDEWNDYYCNEALAMRSDGARFIWTAESFRCYHCDGTFFETKIVDCLIDVFGLETDTNISQSSSHMNTQIDEEEDLQAKPKVDIPTIRAYYVADEGAEFAAEMEDQEDARYVQVLTSECIDVHTCYATVYFAFCGCFNNCSQPFMEVRGADNIRFNIEFNYDFIDSPSDFSENEEEAPQFKPEQPCKQLTTVTIWIGCNLYVSVTDVDFEICTMLNQCSDLENRICKNSMIMKFPFKNSLDSLFYDLTCQICNFKKCASRTKLFYFMEKQPHGCETQGYEFMDCLPSLSETSLSASNTTIEFRPVISINNRFKNFDILQCNDLDKFPRFKEEPDPNSEPPLKKFPYVLETNIYLKIPPELADSKRFEHFMYPIDQKNYKQMRRAINEALIYFVRPEIHAELNRYISFVSWKIKFQKHLRRLAIEDTRKGFYHAMLRYKEYPKYFEFHFNYDGRVSEIDIFEFMLYKCDNDAPRRYTDIDMFNKNCPCPYYLESLRPPIKRSCISANPIPQC